MNEQFIRYISGDMNADETKNFTRFINSSPELRHQIMNYENLLREIKETSNVPLQQDYFVSLIPALRKKLDASSRIHKALKLSFSLSSAAAVIVLALIFLLPGKTADLNQVISEMDHQEVKEMVKDMQIDITPAETEDISQIEELYIEEIDGKGENMISSDLVTNADILNTLSEEETQMIYDEMINKDILKD